MYKIVTFVSLAVLLTCCVRKKLPNLDANNTTYQITDQSLLYFKNVRSYYYQVDKETSPPMELYFWKEMAIDSNTIDIGLSIAVNIYNDAAYLVLTPTKSLKQVGIISILAIDSNNLTDTIHYDVTNISDQIRIAQQIYNAINDGKLLNILDQNQLTHAYLVDEDSRRIFQKIVRDHLRLTGKW